MASSRMQFSIYAGDSHYQIRVADYTKRDIKHLHQRLNIHPASEALTRMDSYEDLRDDEYFIDDKGQLCFTSTSGRLILLREMIDELGCKVAAGAQHLPDPAVVKEKLSHEDTFTEEITHIVEQGLPFYRKGPAALLKGLALRVGVLLLVAIAVRIIYLKQADLYVPRSLQAIADTTKQPYAAQNPVAFFFKPHYTHRSALKVTRLLYSRGNKAILENGYYVEIEGIQNLKATMEAHANAPLVLKVDTSKGEMQLTGVYVGEELITHKGTLRLLDRLPVLGKEPTRVAALDPSSRGAYVKVASADPAEDATFNWMLGQAVSVTARLSADGDRYIIGEDEFKFAIPKENVKPQIQEIMDLAARNNERAIVDMRLSGQAYPEHNRRDPRQQRLDTGIITDGSLHYVQLQSAILKNI